MAIDKSYIEHLKEVESLLIRIKELQDSKSLDINSAVELSRFASDLEMAKNNIKHFTKEYEAYKQSLINGNSNLDNKNLDELIDKYTTLKNIQKQTTNLNNKHFNLSNIKHKSPAVKQEMKTIKNELSVLKVNENTIKGEISNSGVELQQLDEAINKRLELNRSANSHLDLIRDSNESASKHEGILKKNERALKALNINWLHFKSSIRSVGQLLNDSFSIVKNSTQYWREQETAIAKVSNTFGFSKRELGDYRQFILATSVDTQALYGISSEGLIKLQQGYAEATDKAIKFNEEQIHAQAQLSSLMGENESIAYTSEVDKFGVGLSDAVDLMDDIYKTAKNQGISTNKASQDFVKNLKIAQQYNFKGGLQNLKDMTVYSAKMKLNMESIGAVVDKISNPEGAIQTAAKLQVLGGSFSSLANPLQMLYESLEDVGGLGERVSSMFDGMGSFNKKLGEVQFGGMDRQRMKAAAEALGISYEDALSTARERVKRNQIEQDVKFNTNLSKDDTDLIKTLAQFNKKTQQFEVSTFNEETKKYESKAISKISPDDIDKLRGDETDLKDIVQNTQGINDKLDKLTGAINAATAKIQEAWFGDTTREKLDQSISFVQKNSDTIGSLKTGFGILQLGVKGIWGAVETIRALMIGKTLWNNRGAIKSKFGKKTIHDNGSVTYSGARRGWGGASNGVFSKKSLLRGAGATVGLGAVGAGLGMAGDSLKENGHENWGAGASVLGSVAQGASMGSMFGPWGMAIGAGAGLLWGIVENFDKVKEGFSWLGTQVFNLGKIIYNWLPGLPGFWGNIFKWVKGKITGKETKASWTGGVTEVDDGIIGSKKIIANPKDSMMFAKTGGPFDKMFDQIIPKIDMMYNISKVSEKSNFKQLYSESDRSIRELHDSVLNSSIIGKEVKNTSVYSKPIGDDIPFVKEKRNFGEGKSFNKQNIVFDKPLEVKFNGSIKLEADGNKTIDIMSMIKNNPSLLKELTKMISNEISSTINGGRVLKEGKRI